MSTAHDAKLARSMVLLPPAVRGRHTLRRHHQRARPATGPAQRRDGVEVYARPSPRASRLVGAGPRSRGRVPSGGGAQAPPAR